MACTCATHACACVSLWLRFLIWLQILQPEQGRPAASTMLELMYVAVVCGADAC